MEKVSNGITKSDDGENGKTNVTVDSTEKTV